MSVLTVKLKINNVEVEVPEGTMILKAAKDNGIDIPTLCNLEGLTSYGGCRLCLVEISGSPKLLNARQPWNGSHNQLGAASRVP
jgi:bidirectional [NiFe] hydrogenase diaphorase subunit